MSILQARPLTTPLLPTWIDLNRAFPSKVSQALSKISPVASRTFLELGIAILANTAVITFFALPFNAPFTVVCFGNLLVAAIVPNVIQLCWDLYHKEPEPSETLSACTQHLAGLSIANNIGLAGIFTYIHELGHAAAALLCFKNPGIQITVKPFQNGNTSYYIRGLTKVGTILGKQNAVLFVTAAGILSTTLISMSGLALAYSIKDKHPNISLYLNYHAITQIFNDVIYGLTALTLRRPTLSHDFVRLWRLGNIHPLIPIGLMVALPLLEVALLYLWLDKKKLVAKNEPQKIA